MEGREEGRTLGKAPETEARFQSLRASYEREGVARHYARTRWTASSHVRRTDRKEQRLVRELLARTGGCETILDLPCGAGRFVPLLAEHGAGVYLGDVALPMLQEAHARLGHAGSAEQPEGAGAAVRGFFQATGSRLPLADGCVDLVFCFRLVHHFPEPVERILILQELARVSRRWVMISYFDAASFQAWRHRVRGRRKARYPESEAEITAECSAAGLAIEQRRWVARRISEQVIALLRKIAS